MMPAPLLETDDIEVIRTQFAAWMEGVLARFAGLTVPDTPYESRTAAGDAWENGWDVCNERLRRLSVKEGPLNSLRAAYSHYKSVQKKGLSTLIKENGRNGKSPLGELLETIESVLGNS